MTKTSWNRDPGYPELRWAVAHAAAAGCPDCPSLARSAPVGMLTNTPYRCGAAVRACLRSAGLHLIETLRGALVIIGLSFVRAAYTDTRCKFVHRDTP